MEGHTITEDFLVLKQSKNITVSHCTGGSSEGEVLVAFSWSVQDGPEIFLATNINDQVSSRRTRQNDLANRGLMLISLELRGPSGNWILTKKSSIVCQIKIEKPPNS